MIALLQREQSVRITIIIQCKCMLLVKLTLVMCVMAIAHLYLIAMYNNIGVHIMYIHMRLTKVRLF